jgi:hypothetical protein
VVSEKYETYFGACSDLSVLNRLGEFCFGALMYVPAEQVMKDPE